MCSEPKTQEQSPADEERRKKEAEAFLRLVADTPNMPRWDRFTRSFEGRP